MAHAPCRWLYHIYKIMSILFLSDIYEPFFIWSQRGGWDKVACTIRWANIYLTVEGVYSWKKTHELTFGKSSSNVILVYFFYLKCIQNDNKNALCVMAFFDFWKTSMFFKNG